MDRADVPLAARLRLLHAMVEALAADAGIDLLHVKGAAADPEWYPPHGGSDADVIVRPAHVAALERLLAARGWRRQADFDDSSAWAHAATWWHDDWGALDLHRSWPGLDADPDQAYDVLARHPRTALIAHRPCRAPRREAEVLLLALHEGRSGPHRQSTQHLRATWAAADPELRAAVERLARGLGAEVGLAAGLGRLEVYRGHPDHDLWAYYASGGTNRWREWRARLRWARARGLLAPTLRRALRPTTAVGTPEHGVVRTQATRAWHLVRDALSTGRR